MTHPLLEQLGTALEGHIPRLPVTLAGNWLEASRRTCQSEAQLGSRSGPYEDVVDLRWDGGLTADEPIGGIAFLLTDGETYWAKTPHISELLAVDISLHAYADYRTGRATFTARIGGADLPGVPVPIVRDLSATCTIEKTEMRTGCVSCLARAGATSLWVLLLPRSVLQMGRKRLWHVREKVAAALPSEVRGLLTERRSGHVGV